MNQSALDIDGRTDLNQSTSRQIASTPALCSLPCPRPQPGHGHHPTRPELARFPAPRSSTADGRRNGGAKTAKVHSHADAHLAERKGTLRCSSHRSCWWPAGTGARGVARPRRRRVPSVQWTCRERVDRLPLGRPRGPLQRRPPDGETGREPRRYLDEDASPETPAEVSRARPHERHYLTVIH